MDAKPYRVVLVEDNPADILLLKRALGKAASCDVTVFSHGDRAFEYLDAGVPAAAIDLIVLDLNLPGKDGVEILNLIRRKPDLAKLRVAIVSSSPEDVIARKAAEADCYITKPTDLDLFLSLGKKLLHCAGLPVN